MVNGSILIDLSLTTAGANDIAATREGKKASVIVTAVVPTNGKFLNVNDMLVNPWFWGEQERFAPVVDRVFSAHAENAPEQCRPAILGSKVALWDHNLLEVHKWIATLEHRFGGKDLEGATIYLPQSPSRNEIYLYEAEGETSGGKIPALLYDRCDFILDFVRQWFAARGVSRFRRYRLQKRLLGPASRASVRVWAIFLAAGFGHAMWWAVHRLSGRRSSIAHRSAGRRVLALSRSTVHSDYLSPLVAGGGIDVLVADSYRSYPRNRNMSRWMFGDVSQFHLYDVVSFRDILGAVGHTLDVLGHSRRSVGFELVLYGVRISLGQFLREAAVQGFDAALVRRAAERLTADGARSVMHCEMFSQHAVYLARALQPRGCQVFQVAFGTYEMRPTPQFVNGSAMLCFSADQRRSMIEVGAPPDKVVYAGNLHVSEDSGHDAQETMIRRRVAFRTIAFYTQPYLHETEQALVNEIANICEGADYRLLIVLHPRDVRSRFRHMEGRAKIIGNEEYLQQRQKFEAEITLACTRTSNIGYFLILRGVPVANILAAPHDRLVRHEYFEGYPLISTSTDIVRQFLTAPAEVLAGYYAFRADFLLKSYQGRGGRSFAGYLHDRGAM